jgi:hypothetical protein
LETHRKQQFKKMLATTVFRIDANLRYFIGDKITREAQAICTSCGLNSKLLDQQLIYELTAAGSEIVETPLNDQIRSLYEEFGQRPFVNIHLAVLFAKHFYKFRGFLVIASEAIVRGDDRDVLQESKKMK